MKPNCTSYNTDLCVCVCVCVRICFFSLILNTGNNQFCLSDPFSSTIYGVDREMKKDKHLSHYYFSSPLGCARMDSFYFLKNVMNTMSMANWNGSSLGYSYCTTFSYANQLIEREKKFFQVSCLRALYQNTWTTIIVGFFFFFVSFSSPSPPTPHPPTPGVSQLTQTSVSLNKQQVTWSARLVVSSEQSAHSFELYCLIHIWNIKCLQYGEHATWTWSTCIITTYCY